MSSQHAPKRLKSPFKVASMREAVRDDRDGITSDEPDAMSRRVRDALKPPLAHCFRYILYRCNSFLPPQSPFVYFPPSLRFPLRLILPPHSPLHSQTMELDDPTNQSCGSQPVEVRQEKNGRFRPRQRRITEHRRMQNRQAQKNYR